MLLRLFIAILLLSKTTAFAAVSCDVLLSQVAQETRVETQGLSAPARAYVNLIQLYVKQSRANAAGVTEQVLNSDLIVNPFASLKGSQEVQLSAAIKKIAGRLSHQDWQQVKIAIEVIISANAAESKDREEKETEQSVIVNPRIRKEDLDTSNDPRIEWQNFKGDRLISTNTLGGIEIEKFVSALGAKKTIAFYEDYSYHSPSLRVINNRALAVLANFESIFLFELVGTELKLINTVARSRAVDKKVTASIKWHFFGEKVFFTLMGDKDEFIGVYELEGDQITEKTLPPKQNADRPPQALHLIGERLFLTYGTYKKEFKLFEYINGEFKFQDLQYLSFKPESPAVSYSIGGRDFIAVTSCDTNLQIFELLGNKLKLVTSHTIFSNVIMSGTEIFAHKIDDRQFLTFMFDKQLYVFEFVNDQLKLMQVLADFERSFAVAVKDSFYKDNSLHLRILDQAGKVYFVDLFTKLSKRRAP